MAGTEGDEVLEGGLEVLLANLGCEGRQFGVFCWRCCDQERGNG